MPSDPDAAPERVPQLRWWREILYVVGFYLGYSVVRNQFGSEAASAELAYDNAMLIVRAERAMHLFVEQGIQEFFLDDRLFLRFWNIYYGTAHFIVSAFVLGFLYRRDKRRHPIWRNTIFATSALGLIGFSLFPLMPPRLMNAPPPFGGAPYAQEQFGFVDTLAQLGGWWSFDTKTIQELSNQYAAMPSLHCAWATWCALVMVPLVRRRWVKGLAVVYPFLTFFCIIVTGNHFWLDAVGGVFTLLCGYLVAKPLTQLVHRHDREPPAAGPDDAVLATAASGTGAAVSAPAT